MFKLFLFFFFFFYLISSQDSCHGNNPGFGAYVQPHTKPARWERSPAASRGARLLLGSFFPNVVLLPWLVQLPAAQSFGQNSPDSGSAEGLLSPLTAGAALPPAQLPVAVGAVPAPCRGCSRSPRAQQKLWGWARGWSCAEPFCSPSLCPRGANKPASSRPVLASFSTTSFLCSGDVFHEIAAWCFQTSSSERSSASEPTLHASRGLK